MQIHVMTRVLKDNEVIMIAMKKTTNKAIEFIVSKMELVLFSPDEKILKEGSSLKSNLINHNQF